jgi:hypothetical protein
MEGTIIETDGRRVYIRSEDDNDYISSKEHFEFNLKYGHACLIVGMPVNFDVGKSSTGRIRAENIRIVDWQYPSLSQIELTVVNYGNGIGTARLCCGCHCKFYRDGFLTADEYVDNPAVLCTGTRLVANVHTYKTSGDQQTRLIARQIEILGWDEWKESEEHQ